MINANLTWDASVGATGFRIARKVGTGTFAHIQEQATIGYKDSGISENTAYAYQVKAFNAAGESAVAEVSGTSPSSVVASTPLVAPGNLNLSFEIVNNSPPPPPPPPTTGKAKLIEWGWDMLSPVDFKANLAKIEASPFDGLGVAFRYGTATDSKRHLGRYVFTNQALNVNDPALLTDIAAMKTISSAKLTDNLLGAIYTGWPISGPSMDWFFPWQTSLDNMKKVAKIVRDTGLKGVIIDTEDYATPQIWRYDTQPPKPLAEYQAQVNLRGRELMNAMIAEYPDITVLLTFGAGEAAFRIQPGWTVSNIHSGLLPPFVDGMLQAIDAQKQKNLPYPKLIDGFESAYSFKTEALILNEARNKTKIAGRALSTVPALYDTHYKAGLAVFLDYNSATIPWNSSNFASNWYSPVAFKDAIAWRLKHADSDAYVWIWCERVHHWFAASWAVQLPQVYIDATRDGKAL